ncbi:MAG TPA: M67 family metallopeptidase [Candidatus Limnocylindrales bacterium]|nr:M67 family metallopeptidase [Candidatus Limnocylindrales bacterium]
MKSAVPIREEVLARVADHASRDPQVECCGLLAGREGIITRAYPAENVAVNPATAYEIAPREIFDLMREMRAAGLDLLGIYHSHPNGKNEPSPRDIESAYYPDAAYFIISPLAAAPRPVRAFSIRGGRAAELEIQILSGRESNDQSA